MKVAVKKSVLFNLLKTHLNENRTFDNPSGNMVHLSNLQAPSLDPFGVDSDAPIQPSAHMSMQLSVEKPPVDDEDYVPGNNNELKTAAAVIIDELPSSQVEFFYRKLHKILDDALDNDGEEYSEEYSEEDSENFDSQLNESYNISRKTKISDLSAISEATRTRIRTKNSKLDNVNLKDMTPEEREAFDYGDIEGFSSSPNKKEFKDGYDLALKLGDLRGLFEDGEISREEYEKQSKTIEQINLTGTIHFQTGFDAGLADAGAALEFEDSIKMMPKDLDRYDAIFPEDDDAPDRSKKYEYPSFTDYLTRKDITSEQNMDPVFNLIIDSHVAIQRISQKLEDENTKAFQYYWSDPKSFESLDREYIEKMIKPTSAKTKLTHNQNLLPQQVKNMFRTTSKKEETVLLKTLENSVKVIGIIKKMLKFEYDNNSEYKFRVNDAASQFRKSSDDIIAEVADIIAEDYANFARAPRFGGSDKFSYVENAIKSAANYVFRSLYFGDDSEARKNYERKAKELEDMMNSGEDFSSSDELSTDKTPWKFSKEMNVNRNIIVKHTTPGEFADFKEKCLTRLDELYLADDKSSYIIYDNGTPVSFTEDEFLSIFELYMNELEEDIKVKHGVTPAFAEEEEAKDAIELSNKTEDEISEIETKKMQKNIERALKKASKKFIGKADWTFLAPYFGYSAAPGIRQWALKYPKRKFDMMHVYDEKTQSYPFLTMIEETYENIAYSIKNALEMSIIPAMEKKISQGKDKDTVEKKGSIKSVGEKPALKILKMALADINEISDFLDSGTFLELVNENETLIKSIGGTILRNSVGIIFDEIMQDLDKDLNERIGELLIDIADDKDITLSKTDAEWNANYFTGLMKEITPKSKMPQKLIDMGITTYEEFAEVEELTRTSLNNIAKEFGMKINKLKGTSEKQKYKTIIDDIVKDLSVDIQDPTKISSDDKKSLAKLGKLIDKAVVEYSNARIEEDKFTSDQLKIASKLSSIKPNEDLDTPEKAEERAKKKFLTGQEISAGIRKERDAKRKNIETMRKIIQRKKSK